MPVPTTPEGERRVYRDGRKGWRVDRRLRRAIVVDAGEQVVGVPLPVLSHARHRYSLPLTMRLLAWSVGGFDKSWLRRDRDDHLVLRIPIVEMRRALGSVGKMTPAAFFEKDLGPAVNECMHLTNLMPDVQAVRGPSVRPGGGRVLGYDVLMMKTQAHVADTDSLPTPPPAAPAVVVPFRRGRIGALPHQVRATAEDEIDF